jgi:hypothetical protein
MGWVFSAFVGLRFRNRAAGWRCVGRAGAHVSGGLDSRWLRDWRAGRCWQRVLFGAGEAGAFQPSPQPRGWFPPAERGSAHVVVFGHPPPGASRATVVLLIGQLGWLRTFFAFSLLSVVWCVLVLSTRGITVGQPGQSIDRRLPEPPAFSGSVSPNMLVICAITLHGHTLASLTWLPTYPRGSR